jgi:hypothetical protein
MGGANLRPPARRAHKPGTCDGKACVESFGLAMDACVASLVPVPEYLKVIEGNRYVADSTTNAEIEAFSPANKRFVCYYYFAREVFQFYERRRLPMCVVLAVRDKYPNPYGVPYTGYMPLIH